MRVKQSTSTTVQLVLHKVNILDGSGSMGGTKYGAAMKGIALDLETCQKEGFASYTFVEFNDIGSITTHYFMVPPEQVRLKFNGAQGYTPLYRTIGQTLDKMLESVSEGDKVLVNIFTDGKEEGGDRSKYHDPGVLSNLIKTCESKGFTITFIGTESDVLNMVTQFNIDKTNTLVHNNTGEGVQQAFRTQANATSMYSKRVAKGEDVSRGFYSKTIND